MIVVMILHDLCDSGKGCSHTFTKVDYLRGLITLESMVVVCLVVSYIYILSEHNKKALLPDVLREEFTSAVLPILPRNDIVGSQGPDQLSEVMERQAEMIRFNQFQIFWDWMTFDLRRYLHEHTESLCRKIQVFLNLFMGHLFLFVGSYEHTLLPGADYSVEPEGEDGMRRGS